ncbi:hypothetical protein M2447_001031 [Ereboglobus sp. PH5-10]|uniref:hypothetical protein n=1 Tax=Ereboglobus sp. PH5-10 TaxID=2940629 RepID=UPI002405EAEE|nr:hypothetical protein [Ereboglobus sp. PH5-10]MDF9826946.1 hypothetical protein [Ereboglobus sp. PH5-10]
MKLTRKNVGQVVRIIGVPDLSGLGDDERKVSAPVFEYLVGKKKRIMAVRDHPIDAEFEFTIRKGKCKGSHTVWIEPEFLEEMPKRKKRTNR